MKTLRDAVEIALVAIEDAAYGDYVGALNDAHKFLEEGLRLDDSSSKKFTEALALFHSTLVDIERNHDPERTQASASEIIRSARGYATIALAIFADHFPELLAVIEDSDGAKHLGDRDDDAVLTAKLPEGLEKAPAYADELREIAGMLAQAPDGPLRWKQYRIVAVADYLSSIAPKSLPDFLEKPDGKDVQR